jgi:uncharacterized protein YuzE
MHFTYDQEVDILMVYLSDTKIARTERLGDGPILDFAEDGSLVSIEIMGASRHYSVEEMNKYPPNYDEPISLVDAARVVGCTPKALQLAIQRGRLEGKKIGRNWTTTDRALTEYLNSRVHEGPGSAKAV